MQSYSALYIDSATIAIVGQGGMKELKGQGQSGDYRIFFIAGSSKVHLENLKIMNGYVSIHIFVLVTHVCHTNAFDGCFGWCVGRSLGCWFLHSGWYGDNDIVYCLWK